jgi:hypothetical protein
MEEKETELMHDFMDHCVRKFDNIEKENISIRKSNKISHIGLAVLVLLATALIISIILFR